jgi:diguanylate cyclase (GGDEF)-like protein
MLLLRPRPTLALVSLLWAGLSTADAWGLDRNRSVAQHALDRWTTADGLPRNTVEAVARTPDGLLWFATSDGLARLEGRLFRSWTHQDFAGVPPLRTNALVAGTEPGVLWLGTQGSGLLRFDYHTEQHQLLREADGLCDDNISALAMAGQGQLWIGTQSALACRYADGVFTPFHLPEGAKRVVDIATDRRGGVFMAAQTRALLHAPAAASGIQALPGLPGEASAVLVDRGGSIFVGTYDDGVFEYMWDTRSYHPVAPELLKGAKVRRLELDEQGVLWVGTMERGVIRVLLDREQDELERNHVDVPLVTDLLVDPEGSLWITTMGYGIQRLVDHRLYTISARHGLEHEDVLTLAEHPDGGVLVGTAGGGIYHLVGDAARPLLPADDPLSRAEVVSMHRRDRERVWAALYEDGLARLEAGQSLRLEQAGRPGARSSAVFAARDDSLWLGHYDGVLEHIDQGERSYLSTAQGLPGQAITAITERQDGSLWVGTQGGGAAVLDGTRFRAVTSADGLASDTVHGIYEAGNGALWIATSAGLTRFSEGEPFTLDRAHGLPAGAVYGVVEDRSGGLWLTTDNGIVTIDRATVDALISGKLPKVQPEHFDQTRGMLTSECSGGHQSGILKRGDGTLFAATTRGVVVVEPLRAFEERDPPGVVITQLRVAGEPWALPLETKRPRLGRGATDVELSFLANSNLHPSHTYFRYRLVGQDSSWVEADLAQIARFPELAPGRYTFEVQAGQAGRWDGPVTSVDFGIGRYPWQWTWLWVLLGLGAGGAAWALHRRRIMQLEQRRRALEEELDAKTRELRNAALVDPLTGLRNRRFVMEVVLPEVVAFIAQKVSTRQTGARRRSTAETGVYGVFLFDVDHFKKINDSLGHEAGDRMLQQFSYLLRRSVRQDDFVVRWGGEEFLVVLRFSDRDHLDQYARRVREQVERTTFLVSEASGGALKKTASIGYVSLPFFDEAPDLLEFEQALLLADQSLYHAKESGRNRAVRAVATGKVPRAGELQQMARSLEWGIEHGFVRLETFASKERDPR